jgi:hypothetical protein
MKVFPNSPTIKLDLFMGKGNTGDQHALSVFIDDIFVGTNPEFSCAISEFIIPDASELTKDGYINVKLAAYDLNSVLVNKIRVYSETANATYNWTSDPPGFVSTEDTVFVYPDVPSTYFLDAIINNCQVYDTINVSVGVLNLGVNDTVCDGDTVILDAGAGRNSYNWSTSETSQTIEVTTTGTYSVTVDDPVCGILSDEIDIAVFEVPLNLGPDKEVCGTFVQLNAGTGKDSYLWSTGQKKQRIKAFTDGDYSVTVTKNGCENYDTVNVILHQVYVDLGDDIVACAGDTVVLDAGPGYADYTWTTSEKTQSINVTVGGPYAVRVFDAFGCPAFDTVIVTFKPTPLVLLGTDTAQCGGNIGLDAGPGAAKTYSWSNGAVTRFINVTTSGTYSVTVTKNGCSNDDEIIVDIHSLPDVYLGPDVNSCTGQTVQLDAGAGFAQYEWSTAETTQMIDVTTDGTYSVKITDANTCTGTDTVEIVFDSQISINLGDDVIACAGDSVTLNAGSGYDSYSWSTGETTKSIQISTNNDYSVTVTSGACPAATDTVNVTFNTLPVVNLGNDTSICNGTSATLDAGGGMAEYLWSTTATTRYIEVFSAGNIYVTVTDSYGCKNTDEISISLLPNPSVDLGANKTACNGENVILDAGPGYSQYLWNDLSANQTLDVTIAGTYSVTITDSYGCTNNDSVKVIFDTIPLVNLGNDTTIFTNESIDLDAGEGYASYLWSNSSVNQVVTVDGAILGTGDYQYYVDVTNSKGCKGSDTINIEIQLYISVSSVSGNNSIVVYPNLNEQGIYTIKSSMDIHSENILITNTNGTLVNMKLIPSGINEFQLIIDDIPGVYLLNVTINEKLIQRKLIVY